MVVVPSLITLVFDVVHRSFNMLRAREAKMAKSSNKRKELPRTLLQQRIDRMLEQPLSCITTSTTSCPIMKLPTELFQRIAAMLPVLSIVSLSGACRAFEDMLSTENGGNYIFYPALPAPLFMRGERYQTVKLASVEGNDSIMPGSQLK